MKDDIVIQREWGSLTFSYDPCFVGDDFEHEIFDFAKTIIKPNDTIFDIGAHQGSYATFFGWLAKEGMVYAFEPHPLNYEYLLKNTVGYNNIRSIRKAVGESNGTFDLLTWDASIQGTTGRHSLSPEMGGKNPLTVDVVTIDTFVKENNIKVDLIKMDVEMMEWNVIQGARDTILSQRPKMIIEIHGSDWDHKDTNMNLHRIRNHLNYMGMSTRLMPGSITADLPDAAMDFPYTCLKCGHKVTLRYIPKTLHTGVFMMVNC